MSLLKGLWRYRLSIIFIATPLVLLPLPLVVSGPEALCGYCMLLMGVYWMTEVIPLAVTSFLPLILFPILGIMKANDVSKSYFSDTNWLFIGGLIIAVGVETTNLHKRISLKVLTIVGSKPRSLMFGFMATTFFLSMWISNTAATAMMLPIVEAVTKQLAKNDHSVGKTATNRDGRKIENQQKSIDGKKRLLKKDLNAIEMNPETESLEIEVLQTRDEEKGDEKKGYIQKGLAICVPYAASIGGTATINGTGSNVILAGQYQRFFPDSPIKLSFSYWMIYALPSALLFFALAYVWLCVFYLKLRPGDFRRCFKRIPLTKEEKESQRILDVEYRLLGPLSWSEGSVLIVFVSTALLWFFRDPGFINGWSSVFQKDFIDDGTVAVAMSSLLFFLPGHKPGFLQKSRRGFAIPVRPVLTWEDIQRLFPWNVVFLLGGGFALAQGAIDSGLSEWLGDQLKVLDGIDNWLVCLVITIILCVSTEFTSNVATASIFIPILVPLSQSIKVHPIYLLFPSILATSMAFMLPVATPPNAIAFAYGHLKVVDMVKAGSVLNIAGVAIVTLFINTYGVALFDLNEFPDWAKPGNSSV